jgi:hypothetical protein
MIKTSSLSANRSANALRIEVGLASAAKKTQQTPLEVSIFKNTHYILNIETNNTQFTR